jgi:hypothetical protein
MPAAAETEACERTWRVLVLHTHTWGDVNHFLGGRHGDTIGPFLAAFGRR